MPLSRARTRRARSRVNKSARAGWYDVALSEKGHAEAAEGLKKKTAEAERLQAKLAAERERGDAHALTARSLRREAADARQSTGTACTTVPHDCFFDVAPLFAAVTGRF